MKTEDIKKMAQAWKEVQEASNCKKKMEASDTQMGTITVKTDAEREARAKAYRDKKAKNEELKGNQHKIDHNKDGKISAADFKGLRKKAKKEQEVEVQTSEAVKSSWRQAYQDQARATVQKYREKPSQKNDKKPEAEKVDEVSKKTLTNYIKKASDDRAQNAYQVGKTGKMNFKGLKRRQGINRAAQKLAKEEVELDEKVYASDYNVGHEKSQFGGYRPHVTHKKTGKTMYLGQTSYKKPEHAKGHAAAYLKGYEQMGDRTANRMGSEYEKANKKHVYKESVEEAAKHGNTNNGSPAGEGLSPSAKDQLAKKTSAPAAFDADVVNKKSFDAMRASAKKSKMRNGDNAQGDKTPPKGK